MYIMMQINFVKIHGRKSGPLEFFSRSSDTFISTEPINRPDRPFEQGLVSSHRDKCSATTQIKGLEQDKKPEIAESRMRISGRINSYAPMNAHAIMTTVLKYFKIQPSGHI